MGAMYLLTFENGKSYVGITSNTVNRRMALHRYHASTGRDCALHRAIRKYGENSFAIQTLVIADDWNYLCELERKAIVAFSTRVPNGYNIAPGGEGNVGFKMTDEQRARVSAAKKGVGLGIKRGSRGFRHTDEARKKISEAGKGRVFSEERRAKIGATKVGNTYNVGRACREETKIKISEAQKGRPVPDERKVKMSLAKKGRPWSAARRAAQEARNR